MNVGDKCRARKTIIQSSDDYSPTLLLADRGDELEVRKLGNQFYDYYVAHPHREPEAMFGVNAE